MTHWRHRVHWDRVLATVVGLAIGLVIIGVAVSILSSCMGERYRMVPHLGVAHDPQTGNEVYSGGITLAPALELSDRTTEILRPRGPIASSSPPVVVHAGAPQEPNHEIPEQVGWIARYGTYGGAACILALSLLLWVWKRRARARPAEDPPDPS